MFKKSDVGHSGWTFDKARMRDHGHPGWTSVSGCKACKDEKDEKDAETIPGHNHWGLGRLVEGCAACWLLCPKPSKRIKSIYIIGSLRNPEIPKFANELQAQGFEAFADWFSPGEAADDKWREYSKVRGLSYKQALESYGAKSIFQFDKSHLDRCDAAVMLMPAGKSGHLELGYTIGKGKPGYILFDSEPERYDVMVQFATGVFFSKEDLFYELNEVQNNGT